MSDGSERMTQTAVAAHLGIGRATVRCGWTTTEPDPDARVVALLDHQRGCTERPALSGDALRYALCDGWVDTPGMGSL